MMNGNGEFGRVRYDISSCSFISPWGSDTSLLVSLLIQASRRCYEDAGCFCTANLGQERISGYR